MVVILLQSFQTDFGMFSQVSCSRTRCTFLDSSFARLCHPSKSGPFHCWRSMFIQDWSCWISFSNNVVKQTCQTWESPLGWGFDAASNMVRATEQPMCYSEGFMQLILAVAVERELSSQSSSGNLVMRSPRIWDVGSSYGDCLLWASSALADLSLDSLELRGFEPLPAQAAAFERSAKMSPTKILVERLALRDEPGTLEIGFPSHSMALATFQSCQQQYEIPSNYEYQCISRPARAETLDNYLMRLAPSGPIDLLKIHVQGDELSVLHGANASFTSGRICAVHPSQNFVMPNGKLNTTSQKNIVRMLDTLHNSLLTFVLDFSCS